MNNMVYNKVKWSILTFFVVFFSAKAQMVGTYSVPATFTSIAAAISAVNATIPFGPITIEIAANYTETVIYGGFTLTATGTSVTPITFKKNGNGANPLLLAFSGGTNTPSTNFQDGVWQLLGSDYITIDGIDILDTNSLNPATMEYGYGLLKSSISGTNGCQYNTIKNCNISLNRINNQYGVGNNLSKDGSIGILALNSSAISHTNNPTINSPNGSNSFNKFYNNTIQNCNIGIALIGPIQYYFDEFNDIGGGSILTGNRIHNFGGAAMANNKAAGIIARGQNNLNICFNSINNNNGLGINHPSNLFGINSSLLNFATSTVKDNTITLSGGGTTHSVVAILNDYDYVVLPSIGGTLKVDNNLITNCTYSTSTSGPFYGICCYATIQNISISGNIFSNNSSACTSGTYCVINNATGLGYTTTNIFTVGINNNLINNVTLTSNSTSVGFSGIICQGSSMPGTTYSVSINTNSIQAVNYNGGSSGHFNFIAGYGGSVVQPLKFLRIQNNQIINLSIPNTGAVNLITSDYVIYNALISGNKIGSFAKTSPGGYVRGYYDRSYSSTTATTTVLGNNFSNIVLTNSASCNGIELAPTAPFVKTLNVSTNTISAISTGSMGDIIGIFMKDPDSLSSVDNNYISGINGWSISGIRVRMVNSTQYKPVSVNSNTICSLTTTNSYYVPSIYGINVSVVQNSNVYKNKIYDLQCNGNGSVEGISLGFTKGLQKIYNNLIGDLRTPSSNNQLAIKGINVDGANMGFGDTARVSHNSIYINAFSSGTNFGSAGLYHSASTYTTGILDLKNNLVVNTSTAVGTGVTVALYRSPWFLQNYASTSNNNLFYVGGTWAMNKEYYDGSFMSSYSAALTIISPRESNSKIEFPPFQSTIGSNLNFLNLNGLTPTLAESGGLAGTGVSTDILGNIRNVLTPDIGAWEGNFVLPLEINENTSSDTELSIYPNPSTGIFLMNANAKSQIIVFNAVGEVVLKFEATVGINKVEIQNQPGGVYFVKIVNSENKTFQVKKIIKQ